VAANRAALDVNDFRIPYHADTAGEEKIIEKKRVLGKTVHSSRQ
jgi:hypothetical protein